ncbi:DoxX-like family protein [Aureibacillus halotolerans]|uniref:DoxX-like protein n=1 Tax=Aureibacillus halotolerans TaxID=1508390 RepID=A0A4R6TUT2_9BACI|nr:DoxX-like family protein [Aureibacillus halotolerans]TDQ36382.1 DoxX-like protein [Aureibacillus halotolerans]
MVKTKPIYVETLINSDMLNVWEYTQNPDLHQQWDLRFSEIDYLPKEKESDPQRFLYTTKIGMGMRISGKGESIRTIHKDGERVSSLKFWTDHPLSLIKEGSGYWKYVETDAGIQFITQYDYKTRFGFAGKMLDQLFKPLMGWATAWSFDCLKLWLEKEIPPRLSFNKSMIHSIVSIVLAFIWVYQGLVPKILFQDAGELALFRGTGMFQGHEALFLYALGTAQILFGLLILRFSRTKMLHRINILSLVCLGFGALMSQWSIFAAPFNPTTITMAMIGLSLIALLNGDLPNASNCKRQRVRGE